MISEGEGQRLRFARGLARKNPRLVLLDEPFRGLARTQRRDLLAMAREVWADCTLLCVMHDVEDTMPFDRVLVIDGGRVVEDGAPQRLAGSPGSRFRALLDAEQALRASVWAWPQWKRWMVRSGTVVEVPS
jgi:ATP-binding cassette subfamily B protein